MDIPEIASRLGLDETDIYDILALFVRTAPADMSRLGNAYSDGNMALVGETAHSLKGSTATLGFQEISDQAQRIMTACREQNIAESSRLLPQFLDQMKALLQEIRQILDNR